MSHHDLKLGHPSCGDCPIRHKAVCARCESDELAQLDAIKYYRSFQAGQTVIWSGDRMDFVASVVTGIATLTQTMEDGRTQMVGLLLPSDFVGRPGREGSAYDVVATTDLVARPRAYLNGRRVLMVNFGRSGNSAETLGTLDLLDVLAPDSPRLNITCNAASALATRTAAHQRVIEMVVVEIGNHGCA